MPPPIFFLSYTLIWCLLESRFQEHIKKPENRKKCICYLFQLTDSMMLGTLQQRSWNIKSHPYKVEYNHTKYFVRFLFVQFEQEKWRTTKKQILLKKTLVQKKIHKKKRIESKIKDCWKKKRWVGKNLAKR